MTIIETEYKPLDQWSEDIQQTIIDKHRFYNIEHVEWYDDTIDTFKEVSSLFGLDIENIYFSGFSSQGDGACFTGSYSYKKGALKQIKSEYPQWKELHDIVKALQDLQKRYCYQLNATITHSGRYVHEYSAGVTTDCNNRYDIAEEAQYEMSGVLRDWMREIYRTLEKEFDYLTSDETLKEYFIDSGLEFSEEGDIL